MAWLRAPARRCHHRLLPTFCPEWWPVAMEAVSVELEEDSRRKRGASRRLDVSLWQVAWDRWSRVVRDAACSPTHPPRLHCAFLHVYTGNGSS